jgi:UDP-N-acetylmuramoyl-tripeptide--D-alanyl-D-alanine ligase
LEIVETGARTIINDAYNANPESMAAALRTLATIAQGRPTVAVLGQMAELGEHTAEAHDRIGRLAVRLGIGSLVVVGDEARAIHEAARLEGMFGGESHLVGDVDAAIGLLEDVVAPDAVVLVKASRAAGLERVVEALVDR